MSARAMFGRCSIFAVTVLMIASLTRLHSYPIDFVFDDALTNCAAGSAWSYPKDGFVYGSTQGAYYLRKSDCAVVSPEFAFSITSITVSVKCTSTRNLLAVPIIFGEMELGDAIELTPSVLKDGRSSATGVWPLSLNVHKFALLSNAGAGNVYLFDGSVDGERVPEGLRATLVYANAFAAAWDPMPGAIGYELKVEQFIEQPPVWNELAGWSFASYTNNSGSVAALDRYRFAAENPGLSGENLQLPAHHAGSVQVGSSVKLGRLRVDNLPATVEMVLFKADKPTSSDYGADMPVYWVTETGSNSLGSVKLTASPQQFALALPAASAGAALEFSSTTNHLSAVKPYGSVNLYEVRLVSDYHPSTTSVVELSGSPFVVGRRCSKMILTGTPGRFRWQVVAISADGSQTSAGEIVETGLSAVLPKYRQPGTTITIR